MNKLIKFANLQNLKIIKENLYRRNLIFKKKIFNSLTEIYEKIETKIGKFDINSYGIIYLENIKKSEKLKEKLEKKFKNLIFKSFSSVSENKEEILKNFIENKINVIIATSAFSRG